MFPEATSKTWVFALGLHMESIAFPHASIEGFQIGREDYSGPGSFLRYKVKCVTLAVSALSSSLDHLLGDLEQVTRLPEFPYQLNRGHININNHLIGCEG